MKKLALISALLLTASYSWGQDLGLPRNVEGPRPAKAAKVNTSYSATVSVPDNSCFEYFDLPTNTNYIRDDNYNLRRIEKLDSLVMYVIHDKDKTYEKNSLDGVQDMHQYRKTDEEIEYIDYCGRWCEQRRYTQWEKAPSLEGEDGLKVLFGQSAEATMEEVGTEMLTITDLETGIILRQDQNGGTMLELSDIKLGVQPGKRFSVPKDYKREAGKDIGRMLREAQKVQDSDDGAALQDLINSIRDGKFNN